MVKNHLLDLSLPVFLHIIELLEMNDSPDVIGNNLYEETKNIIETLEYRGRQKQLPIKVISDVKFALVATIDEIIMLTEKFKSLSGIWCQRSMQYICFASSNAGEEFFSKIESLSLGGTAESQILEVYFYCIQLGFRGKYYGDNNNQTSDNKFARLQQKIYDKIMRDCYSFNETNHEM